MRLCVCLGLARPRVCPCVRSTVSLKGRQGGLVVPLKRCRRRVGTRGITHNVLVCVCARSLSLSLSLYRAHFAMETTRFSAASVRSAAGGAQRANTHTHTHTYTWHSISLHTEIVRHPGGRGNCVVGLALWQWAKIRTKFNAEKRASDSVGARQRARPPPSARSACGTMCPRRCAFRARGRGAGTRLPPPSGPKQTRESSARLLQCAQTP